MVFHLDPFRAEGLNGYDMGRECGAARRVLFAALTLLKQARVDGLRFQAFVDFLCSAPLENDAGDSYQPVPDREIRNYAAGGQREDVGSFVDGRGVAAEDLADGN